VVPHLKWCTLTSNGLIYIARNKSNFEKSYAAGRGGGFRSSENFMALMQTISSVSNIHI